MMSCETCRVLLAEGLDLCVRARKLDAETERALAASGGRCGTPALWIMDQYDRDLTAWEDRSRTHLQQGCAQCAASKT